VAHINAGTFPVPVTAVRLFQPAFTLEDLKALRVSVVPRTVQMVPASRDSLTLEYVLDIGVQQKLPAEDADAVIEQLLELVEALGDHVRLKRLPDFADAAWAAMTNEPVLSTEAMEQHRVFTSVLNVTYRERR
jgi:hypothetical protein